MSAGDTILRKPIGDSKSANYQCKVSQIAEYFTIYEVLVNLVSTIANE